MVVNTVKMFFATLLISCMCAPCAAQLGRSNANSGVVKDVETHCNVFAKVAKEFLRTRGLKVARSLNIEEDWACGKPGFRCIVFQNAPPRSADGKLLVREDVVREYWGKPASIALHRKYYGHGYWAVPGRNFTMGASLQLLGVNRVCKAKLEMGLGLRATMYLVVVPYELRDWELPPDNGRLQTEYMEAIVMSLPHQ